MSIRRAALLAMLLAALAAAAGAGVPALAVGSTPAPLQPDQATALATAPGGALDSTTAVVNGQTALDAAAAPGASTSIESGVSPQAAVGLAPLQEGNIISASRPVCWRNSARARWGTWPYDQRITDTTYWCAIYGSRITYRSSSVTGSGTLCGTSWTSSQLVAGGVGYSWFTMRSSAGFSCPTAIPWLVLHPSHYEDIARNDWGSTSTVRSG